MARRKKDPIKVACTKCGYEPEPDKDKSNENWMVYSTKCPKCGGVIMPLIPD